MKRIVSKRRTAPNGRPYGGKPIARGALYLMLQNRIYRGEIVHKDQSYPGEHDPIINDDLWQEVQTTLATNPGRLWCRQGQPPVKPVRRSHLRCARRTYDAESCCKEGYPVSLLRLQIAADRERRKSDEQGSAHPSRILRLWSLAGYAHGSPIR